MNEANHDAEQRSFPISEEPYRIQFCDHTLDNIYGQIGLTDVERSIERLTVFKRLHNISQLGLVNWIFPCALHTRYTHSIGVMHVAGEMARHINMNRGENSPFFSDNDIQIIRLAGLLHDIGHYPMSHNVEQAYKDADDAYEIGRQKEMNPAEHLRRLTKCPDFLNPLLDTRLETIEEDEKAKEENEKNKKLQNEEEFFRSFKGSEGFHHEMIGAKIITSNAAIFQAVKYHFVLLKKGEQYFLNKAFESDEHNSGEPVSEEYVNKTTKELLNAVGEMVRGNYENKSCMKLHWLKKYSAMIQLIHSELDADNLDYLLRDATFSGTSYGIMDMGVLLNSLRVSELRSTNDQSLYMYIVGVKKKGTGCVEQFQINKFMAYTQMILSKYVSILESMLLYYETKSVGNDNGSDTSQYSCKTLGNMVEQADPSDMFYAFTDHHIFETFHKSGKDTHMLKEPFRKIVLQLNSLRAFYLDSKHANEFICTTFSEEELKERIEKSEVYKEFAELCQDYNLSDQKAFKDKLDQFETNLFPFRFEQYRLTKQRPLNQFLQLFQFNEMIAERRFKVFYLRLADGIPILEKDFYSFDEQVILDGVDADSLIRDENMPMLCVDSPQSCLHTMYPMQYLSLRRYQYEDLHDETYS